MATALYLRISLDDENRTESDSISNQRDLLRSYVAADPSLSAGEVLEFSDDGWSGTNFERPQVKALLDMARRGGIKNILVKDLSRKELSGSKRIHRPNLPLLRHSFYQRK
jgi:DNA invertase Pin-like site-specific DNA recombinase